MAEQKKPRGRPKGSTDTKPRDTTACVNNLVKARENSPIRFMQMILPSDPLDCNDVAEMERRFARYLELCAEWGMKVGNMAAYAAIGIDKDTAYEWTSRRTSNPARYGFIKKVQQVCALYREGLMEDGKVNPVTGIFWQKNYDGLKDQQEVVLTPNNPLGEAQNAEQLKQKYLESADIVELPESAERDDFSKTAEGAESPPDGS